MSPAALQQAWTATPQWCNPSSTGAWVALGPGGHDPTRQRKLGRLHQGNPVLAQAAVGDATHTERGADAANACHGRHRVPGNAQQRTKKKNTLRVKP